MEEEVRLVVGVHSPKSLFIIYKKKNSKVLISLEARKNKEKLKIILNFLLGISFYGEKMWY